MIVTSDHHVAIDGILKQNTSIVKNLSVFSYKTRIKGNQDVSVIYIYGIEAMEPISTKVSPPGSSIDAVPYRLFIPDDDIRKRIIIAYTVFPLLQIIKKLGD